MQQKGGCVHPSSVEKNKHFIYGVRSVLSGTDYEKLASWFSLMFSAALAFSVASMVAMLLVNLSFGIMTKAAPQLNIFSLGFSISMVFGLFVLWVTLVNVPIHFENQWLRGINLMCELLNNVCEKP